VAIKDNNEVTKCCNAAGKSEKWKIEKQKQTSYNVLGYIIKTSWQAGRSRKSMPSSAYYILYSRILS
jgi:hypothetical protein